MTSDNKSKNTSFGFAIGIVLAPLMGLLLAVAFPSRGIDYLLTVCLPISIAIGLIAGRLLGDRISQLSESNIWVLTFIGIIIWTLVILAIEILKLY